MKPDWNQVLARLRAYPKDLHNILPPCPAERVEAVQTELGKMPDELSDMLLKFNGAELFQVTGPSFTIFGITSVPPLPASQWAPDWQIDKFTPAWRRASSGRDKEWAIAMMCYGVVIILDQNGMIKEWSRGQCRWERTGLGFDDWIEDIFREGDIMLKELAADRS